MFSAFKTLLSAGCTLAAFVSSAQAGIVFVDNFGQGDSYDPYVGRAISYSYPTMGQPFNAQYSYPLESIVLALSADYGITTFGGANDVDVFLMSDAAARPGAVLEAFHLSNALPWPSLSVQSPLIITSALQPLLQRGERYWVVVSVANYATRPAVYVDWHQNATGLGGPIVYQARGDSTWYINTPVTLGAYRVTGVLVPEPSTLLLGMVALLAGALRRVPGSGAAGR